MALLSFAAYRPLLEQMLQASQNAVKYGSGLYDLEGNLITGLVFGLFWKTLLLCFKGPLIWFSWLIIAGIALSKTIPSVYRWFPIWVVCCSLILIFTSDIISRNKSYVLSLSDLIFS